MTVAPTSIRPTREHRPRWVLYVVLAFLVGGVTGALLYRFDAFGGSSSTTNEGSGVPATQVREVPAFDSVELAGANNVLIHVGEKQSVVVKADANLLDRVTTRVHSGRLVIANTPGSFNTKSPMSVEVTLPSLNGLNLTGNGNIAVTGIEAESLAVSLPGNGTLTGSGNVTRLAITVSGSGSVQFTRLVADSVRATVSGSGSIFTTATGSLQASVSGSGAILYTGHPADVTKDITGTGTIVGG